MTTARRRAGLAAALLLLFLLDAALIESGTIRPIDQALLGWDRINGNAHAFADAPWLLTALIAVTQFGGAIIRAPVTIVAGLLLLVSGRPREGIVLAGAVALDALLLWAIKLVVARARPDIAWWLVEETRPSFPSGHAMGSMILYPLLGVVSIAPGRGRTIAIIAGTAFALLIGATRILLGVHWFSDVVGGWLLGGACALIAAALLDRLRAAAPPAR